MVTVDINPPLAVKVLTFDIDIDVVAVRQASEQEIKHGHVHNTKNQCEKNT